MCEYSIGYHRVISNTVNMRPSSVCLLCGMIWIYLRGYECCRFGLEVNCGFPCRCTDGNQCNSETGECAPGSECLSVLPNGYGWSGTGCRIGNVAYKKTASQSGGYRHYFADLAVDGLTYPFITNMKNETCAHPQTQTGELAWWEVDLGATYRIQSITIINRNHSVSRVQERTGHFHLRIGNNSNPQHECLYRGVPIGDQATLYCNNAYTVGRYIRFQRTAEGIDPDEANFCEFIVMGYETIDCDNENCAGQCDRLLGCHKCAHGKMLPDCNYDCPNGFWGENCVNTCGQCKDGAVCDKVTGSCGEQCDGWFIPELCIELLGPPPETLNVTLPDIASDSAKLLWLIPSDFDDAVKLYFYFIVKYRKKFQPWNRDIIPLSNEESIHYELIGLDYNTNYEVEIIPNRNINGQTELGTVKTKEFKTLCIAPERPPTPFISGTPDRFTVTWDLLTSISHGCDRLESLAVIITCENSTHTMFIETHDILIVNTEFTYETTSAISCSAVLFVTNDEGYSSTSSITTVTTTSTKSSILTASTTDGTSKLLGNEPNITAIAVGAVAGVVIIVMIVVIVVLVLRRRITRSSSSGTKPDTISPGYAKANPVYENTKDSHNDEIEANPPGDYASVEDTAIVDMKVSPTKSTHGLYEHTKGPGSEYESVDDSLRTTPKPSPVYQELK